MKIHQYVENSLLLAINSSYTAIWRDLNSKLKNENCNLVQALILISIFFESSSDPVMPSHLAKVLNTTRANISHSITHLEKKKMLKRTLNGSDARSYRLLLLPEGRKTALRLIQVIDEVERYFENQFGKDAIGEMIQRIALLGRAYKNKNEWIV